MKSDAGRSFEVFEFKEEDELPDIVPGKYPGRLKNVVAGGDDAILKYNYLGFFSNQSSHDYKVSADAKFVDVDSVDSDHGEDAFPTTGEERETNDDVINCLSESKLCKSPVFVQKRITAERGSQSFSQNQDTTTSRCVDTRNQILQPMHEMPEGVFHTEDRIADAKVSDSEERVSDTSPADLLSGFAVNSVYFDDQTSDSCSGSQENRNKEITVEPDIVVLNDKYIWDAEMRFTSNNIQLTGLNTRGDSSAQYNWPIDNIISIKANWHEKVHATVVLVHVLPENSSALDPSGIQEIKLTMYETDWANEQEGIMSLNDKYMPLFAWNDCQSWPNQTINGKLYYPEFDDSFDELVFPKNDSDPVTICKRDIDLLEPESFINDTIIDFYIKYLKDRLEPEKAHKFHFFNSFFFRKLADLERSQFDASEGRTSFLRVRKWTRKVNLFEKDYIFIPVNSNLHWSLIVICHPGEIAKFEDNNVKSKHKVPCILHMDSIKGSHTGLKNHIQSYLWEEWKEKQNESTEEISLKFHNLRFISLEVPQQENSYDCGLFLLHYVELFLEEAPDSFNPFCITKFSTFLNANWFPPGDVSLKRAHIQRIIYNVNMDSIHPQQSSPSKATNQISCPKSPNPNNENKAEFHYQAHINGLPDAAVQDFNHKSSNSQLKSYLSSIEENAGNDDHMMLSLPNGAEFTTQSDEASFHFIDNKMQNLWPAVNSIQQGVDSTENLEFSRSLKHESDYLLNGEVERDAQTTDAVNVIQEIDVGSTLIPKYADLSETTCCPSPVVLESMNINMANCSEQINTCDITDAPKDLTLVTGEKQNGESSGEYKQDIDIDTSELLDELPVPKRARTESS